MLGSGTVGIMHNVQQAHMLFNLMRRTLTVLN